jgi:hypothetical protein
MATEHPKIEHQLKNGDVLIIATTERDPKVDEAFRETVEHVRRDNRERFLEFRKAKLARG